MIEWMGLIVENPSRHSFLPNLDSQVLWLALQRNDGRFCKICRKTKLHQIRDLGKYGELNDEVVGWFGH